MHHSIERNGTTESVKLWTISTVNMYVVYIQTMWDISFYSKCSAALSLWVYSQTSNLFHSTSSSTIGCDFPFLDFQYCDVEHGNTRILASIHSSDFSSIVRWFHKLDDTQWSDFSKGSQMHIPNVWPIGFTSKIRRTLFIAIECIESKIIHHRLGVVHCSVGYFVFQFNVLDYCFVQCKCSCLYFVPKIDEKCIT